MSDFEKALSLVLVHEGGNVDHPKDPGGRTSHGVIQRVYDGWRKKQGLPTQDVWKSTPAERAAIYKAQYWDAARCDELPAGVGYVVFDGAVNSGPSQSVKWLQRALDVTADGNIGAVTIAAANAHRDHDELIAAICAKRLAFLMALRTWPTFGKGWRRRVDEVRRNGQRMANGELATLATSHETGREKATASDARKPRSIAAADAATGAGVPIGVASAALNDARAAIEPLAGSSSTISAIIVALVVAGVVLTIGGLVYRFWAARKNKELSEALI